LKIPLPCPPLAALPEVTQTFSFTTLQYFCMDSKAAHPLSWYFGSPVVLQA
jgi:hypothetical protein